MTPAQTDSRMSPLTLRIMNEIEDGEWHDWEDVIDAVMYTIPPGEAFRFASNAATGVVERRSQAELIASGRRSRTIQVINTMISNGRVERNTTSRKAQKKIRLTKRVARVYVVRNKNGDLDVLTYGTGSDLAIHVVDAWKQSDNPESDAASIQEVISTIPKFMPDKEKVQEVCRYLLNRLNVAAAMARVMEQTTPTNSTPANNSVADGDAEHGGMTYEY